MTFLFYSILIFLFVIFSYLFIDPNFIYQKKLFTGFFLLHREAVSFGFLSLVIILFSFYIYFLKLINRGDKKRALLKKLVFISLILVLSYPAMLSFDIFNYIFTAKVIYLYKENPYIVMPIELVGDPMLLFTHAANKTALYGPFWIFLTSIPFSLGLGNFIVTLYLFKFFVLAFYLGTSFLIYKISKNIYSVAIFSLNPLILIETLVSSHNDVVMMFLALLSLFLLIKKKIAFAILFLFLSFLIKFATIFLLPIFIYVIYQYYKKRKFNWNRIFLFSAFLMFFIFFLSFIREEIYPWYAIWFLTFTSLIPNKKFIFFSSIIVSFSLMFRYLPYMYLGTHFGPTPILKIVITFLPITIFSFYHLFKEKYVKN